MWQFQILHTNQLDMDNEPEAPRVKVTFQQADITTLEVNAIVNAANNSLLGAYPLTQGGGGVDGAIHRAAGKQLRQYCKVSCCNFRTLMAAKQATQSTRLDSICLRNVTTINTDIIHAVGPVGEYPEVLEDVYRRCMEIVCELNLKSVAFPCISTGVYGYPQENAAKVAMAIVKACIADCPSLEEVVFCVFLDSDVEIYTRLFPSYFPEMVLE
jgi:O-acetyl-ADP-ribose deacetylase